VLNINVEDRVIANLSGDNNKIAVFSEGLDGHSLAATYYYPDRIADMVGEFTDNKEASRLFKKLTKTSEEAGALRQESKPVTFKLAYGGFPDVDKGGTITQEIFDNYHNKMYPNISAFRNKVIDKVKQTGYTHIGLGLRLYSDTPDKDSRTLFNANSQFWSILTAISINELHHRQAEAKIPESDLYVTSTIYDSIYGIIKADPALIKWLNNNLVEIMVKDFMDNQIVHNEANLEIGPDWASQTELPNNCSTEEIKQIMKEL
jgi:effector-binding domain-containing protein